MNRLEQVEAFFFEALAIPATERAEWLRAHCAEDSLRDEVHALLNAHEQMEAPAPAADGAKALVPTRIGAWRTLRLLGRGGMSTVYLAERADGQFSQTAALKVMAAFLDTPEFHRRFHKERQFLAGLNHPNITRLIDGGLGADDTPYLVMEYVEGQPLNAFTHLPVDERLGLFQQVCEAVAYAHANLIVHRDLKPGNILVTNDGTVKLLDFGTASLLAAVPDLTATRIRLMTPRYASPEQLRGERASAATDIFALGVILYELLTGVWPFGNPESILAELNRALGEVPPKPPAVPPDLAALLLKALEYEPSRRYASVRDLTADVENYRAGRPVLARPQTALYRGGKFLRRRWLPVSAAAVFACGLLAATGITIRQASIARAEASKAAKVNQFLNDILASSGEMKFDPKSFTVLQMLDASAQKLERNWKNDPITEAIVRRSLGVSYSALLEFGKSREQFNRALQIFRTLGEQKEEAETLVNLGAVATNEGNYAESATTFEQALRTPHVASSKLGFTIRSHLAFALFSSGQRPGEVRDLCREALFIAERNTEIPRTELAIPQAVLGGSLLDKGKFEEAGKLLRQAASVGRLAESGGWIKQLPLYYLMVLHARRQEWPEAREYARQRLEVFQKTAGENGPSTLAATILYQRFRAESGDSVEALAAYTQLLPRLRKSLPPRSFNLWNILIAGACIQFRAGNLVEAERNARESLELFAANKMPERDARRAESLYQIGRALRAQGKESEASGYLQRAGAMFDELGPGWTQAAARTR